MKKIFLLLFICIFSLGFSQKKKKTKSKAVVEKETVIIYTEQDAETSKETRVIAGFIKQNPGHARNDYFKKRLMEIIMADNSPEAKPTIKPISKEKIENIVKNNELNSGKVIAANKTSAAKTENNTNNSDKVNNAINALKEERLASYASANSAKSAGTSAKAGPSEANKKTAAMLTHLFNNDVNKNEAYVNIKNRSSCNLIVKINGKKYYNLSVPAKGENFILIDKGEYVLTTMVCDAKYSSLKKITQDIEIALNVSE
ncbi:DUF6759 domain-containing protein [Chryseobacterium arthrosphaerae]|uniref:DUF6759 domain-containing protein n=1 Tax=Chryseobacterium arthrosphaerae TaxID=651561 RepID=A0A1B8ZVD5_9FLAO|nr:DUF6759 domain-containing protein [Chryseobacterium arthrosphaerae]AYZ13996.1 hypothetical protein EGY05_19535 [Chryseobacterium arthrosphaerae]MDG4654969.1 hypothetical protein [Chryseobacterium arthrosphaerae]OCA75549.1 hypothetical protein BBI00_14970 [Chryseobacterium arthrosphaerae]QUY54815.1 hypothetical protein I2F65_18330 [Chryseobacterium arthrosphaerae]RTZ50067.1 hypothetical protein EJ377_08385 [Chryseobacterium arthrosphaerae]